MHNASGKNIFMLPVVAKGFTSKVTQLIVNPRCNVARFSYEMFHDHIDQGIDSIKNSSSYALVKDGGSFLIFLDLLWLLLLGNCSTIAEVFL